MNNLVQRAIRICTQPDDEWRVIEPEPDTPQQVIAAYLLPLAVAGAIAAAIGGILFGLVAFGGGRHLGFTLLGALVSIVATVAGCIIAALAVDALAPTFNGRPDRRQAFKLVVYSATPALLVNLLRIIPFLGLLAIVGAIWSAYVMLRGIPVMMKAPQERALPYALVVIVVYVVASILLGMLAGMLFFAGNLARPIL